MIMKRLMEQRRTPRIASTLACAAALSLAAAACTGGSDEAATDEVDGTNPPALASGDDDTVDAADPDGDEADTANDGDGDTDGVDDAFDNEPDANDDAVVGPTTPQTIVPPGETAPANGGENGDDEGQGGQSTTTTASPTTDRSEQPIQEQDTALVCATVEQGFIAILSGSDDVTGLGDGADMALNSGVEDYEVLGEALRDAVDEGEGLQDAADALLSRCEEDGFERLA